jgi:PhnB protein
MQLIPYLMFNGNCKEAFEVYQQTLGGEMKAMLTYGTLPEDQRGGIDPNAVMHACLEVDGELLMASDDCMGAYVPAQGMSVSIHPKSLEEGTRIFNAFAEGGTVIQPLMPTFFSTGFGILKDRFGTPWMFNCPAPSAE